MHSLPDAIYCSTVTPSAAAVPQITNSATASATGADLTPGNNSASADTQVDPVADLTITKADNPDPIEAGGTLTYTINVSNAGQNTATGLAVTDNLPSGATFTNNGNGTGTFNWTPTFTQSGSYNVTFRATDGLAVDTEVVSIIVNESGNQAPVLATIGAKSVTECALLTFGTSATDPDGKG